MSGLEQMLAILTSTSTLLPTIVHYVGVVKSSITDVPKAIQAIAASITASGAAAGAATVPTMSLAAAVNALIGPVTLAIAAIAGIVLLY
ncbi:MAG: hypothetical protein NC548_25720 [Lachnospiraceae bacterium]|nr:hypothetical protein [Lachnospiraceae bacterium]